MLLSIRSRAPVWAYVAPSPALAALSAPASCGAGPRSSTRRPAYAAHAIACERVFKLRTHRGGGFRPPRTPPETSFSYVFLMFSEGAPVKIRGAPLKTINKHIGQLRFRGGPGPGGAAASPGGYGV